MASRSQPFLTTGRWLRARRWLVLGGLVALALLLVAIAYAFPQRILTLDDGPVTADAMIVLGGGSSERPARALELFQSGEAPKILVSGINDCELYSRILEKHGVPAAVITKECRSVTTFENAKFSVPLLRQMGARRVIIVTTWYHARRALATFEHFAPEIRFYSRPSYFGYPLLDWRGRNTHFYMVVEYFKIIRYWLWYGIPPWT